MTVRFGCIQFLSAGAKKYQNSFLLCSVPLNSIYSCRSKVCFHSRESGKPGASDVQVSRDGTVAHACLRLAGLRRSHPAGRVQSRRYWTVVVLLVRNCQCDRDSVALRLIKFYLYTILRLVSIKF